MGRVFLLPLPREVWLARFGCVSLSTCEGSREGVDEVSSLSELYERLKKEREHLLSELEKLRIRLRPPAERREGSPFGKKGEEASEAFELERRLAEERRLSGLLAEVEHALEKYQAGTYGLCDLCGQPINPERLEVLPQANLCLRCKARQAKRV